MRASRAFTQLLLALISSCLAAPAQAGVTAWIPLEVRDGHVSFPVEIAGRAGHAAFDTGAAFSSVSTEIAKELGLKLGGRRWMVQGVGSTDETVTSESRLPIKLFGIDFELHDVAALPHRTDMIIGAGFLKSFVLQLDYPNSRMRLITEDSIDLAKAANVPLRLDRGTGLPAIRVKIDGRDRWMLLDTGNSGPIVMRRLVAREADWLARFKRAEGSMIDVNANVTGTDILVLPSFAIGPYELEDVPVAIPAEGESLNLAGGRASGGVGDSRIQSGVRVSGIVGYEVLRHFVVTIDYDRQKMHVAAPQQEPQAAPAEAAPARNAAPPSEPAHAAES